MRKEYYSIYRDLVDVYRVIPDRWYAGVLRFREPFFARHLVRRVSDAVTEVLRELELTERLRPDGMHFLVVNLHQMVMLPLSHPDAEAPSLSELDAILRDDVRIILVDARSNVKDNPEITGYDLVDALSRVKNRLMSSQWGVWG